MLDTLTTGGSAANLAYGLNENGTIVGQSFNSIAGNNEAVMWDSNGNITSLGFTGIARAVNNSGVIVGETGLALLGNPNGYAFRWENGVTTDLGNLGGNFAGAYDINDAGQITGFAADDPEGYFPAVHRIHAFRWENGVMTELGGTFPTNTEGYGRGHGINDSGHIAGRASSFRFENSEKHQSVWLDTAIDFSALININKPNYLSHCW